MWHSECQNGTARWSGVDTFQPYKSRLCYASRRRQNGTKTTAEKLQLCAKSPYSFMVISKPFEGFRPASDPG
jgi:hypothetical protein